MTRAGNGARSIAAVTFQSFVGSPGGTARIRTLGGHLCSRACLPAPAPPPSSAPGWSSPPPLPRTEQRRRAVQGTRPPGARPTRPASGRRAAGGATCGSRSSRAGSARCSTPTSPPRARATWSWWSPTAAPSPTASRPTCGTASTRPDASSLRFTQTNTDKGGHYRIVKSIVTDPRRDASCCGCGWSRSTGGSTTSTRCTTRPSATTARTTAPAPPADALVAQRRVRRQRAGVAPAVRPHLQRLRRHGQRRLARPRGPPPAQHDLRRRRAGQRRPGRPDHRRDGTARAPHRDAGPRLRWDAGGREAYGGHVGRGRRTPPRLVATTPAGTPTSAASAACPRARPASGGSTSPPPWCWPPPRTSCTRARSSPRPSAPWVWGDNIDGLSTPSGAYHEVWSRDAYQFGTALWADGDKAAARRIVDWLFTAQQKPDGSFPQNSDVTGKPVWTNLQLDEVALPIVLAQLTGQDRRGDVRAREEVRRLPRDVQGQGHRPRGAVLAAGALGEPGRLLAELHRGPDQRTGVRGRDRPRER